MLFDNSRFSGSGEIIIFPVTFFPEPATCCSRVSSRRKSPHENSHRCRRASRSLREERGRRFHVCFTLSKKDDDVISRLNQQSVRAVSAPRGGKSIKRPTTLFLLSLFLASSSRSVYVPSKKSPSDTSISDFLAHRSRARAPLCSKKKKKSRRSLRIFGRNGAARATLFHMIE